MITYEHQPLKHSEYGTTQTSKNDDSEMKVSHPVAVKVSSGTLFICSSACA